MQLKSLAVAAGLAAATSRAFVIVPEIAQVDIDIVNLLPTNADSRLVKLGCPDCPPFRQPFAPSRGSHSTKLNVPLHLELDFTIEHGARADRLLVNGFELYPKADPWHGALMAPVVDSVKEIKKHPQEIPIHAAKLGYGLTVHPVAKDQDNQQLELVEVELQVIEVGEAFVKGVPGVKVQLIKSSTGRLAIAKVDTIDTQPVVSIPAEMNKDCDTMLCRWHEFIMENFERLRKMKGCAGRFRHGQHSKGHHGKAHHGKAHHHHQPAEGQGYVPQHHHTWRQLMKNITSYILLPILIGILAGVTLSILGMVVGTLFVFLWRVLVLRQNPFSTRRHRRRRGRSYHKSNQHEVARVEEKTRLMSQQEPQPEYESAALVAATATEDAADEQV